MPDCASTNNSISSKDPFIYKQPTATWEMLGSLSKNQLNRLHDIVRHVNHSNHHGTNHGDHKNKQKLICLFEGPTGVGKTMAAEVIARSLNLNLFQVDISQVVDKYIDETEPKLKKIFDVAEHTGAVLFFKETDELFDKRYGNKDKHERYANEDANLLLSRLENFNGIVILTTHARYELDEELLHCLSFVIDFSSKNDQ